MAWHRLYTSFTGCQLQRESSSNSVSWSTIRSMAEHRHIWPSWSHLWPKSQVALLSVQQEGMIWSFRDQDWFRPSERFPLRHHEPGTVCPSTLDWSKLFKKKLKTYLFNLAYPGISQWLSPDKLSSNMDLKYVKFGHWSLLWVALKWLIDNNTLSCRGLSTRRNRIDTFKRINMAEAPIFHYWQCQDTHARFSHNKVRSSTTGNISWTSSHLRSLCC